MHPYLLDFIRIPEINSFVTNDETHQATYYLFTHSYFVNILFFPNVNDDNYIYIHNILSHTKTWIYKAYS